VSNHLSFTILNALADGELSADQLAMANEHLAGCPACTMNALHQSLLKTGTAKAGQRYEAPPQLQRQLSRMTRQEKSRLDLSEFHIATTPPSPSTVRFRMYGWSTAAALLLASAGMLYVEHSHRGAEIVAAERAALTTEVFDQHVAMLAASLPPQVVSTDRHTVKPWFQGKMPFTFNLPEKLPQDTTLDGANLTYLYNQPVAQLLYSIGKHRVSIFVREQPSAPGAKDLLTEHAGFHVIDGSAAHLEFLAVSDVDPSRLAGLMDTIEKAQTEDSQQLQ